MATQLADMTALRGRPAPARAAPRAKQRELVDAFVKEGDSLDDVRVKAFVVKLSLVLIVVCGGTLIVQQRLYSLRHAHTFSWVVSDCIWASGFAVGALSLAHLYTWGLSTAFKASYVISLFSIVTLAVHIFSGPLHICYVLILDLLLVVQGDKEEIILNRLSVVLRVAIVAVVGAHVFNLGGIGSNDRPFNEDRQTLLSEFLLGVLPTLLNFSMIRTYARSALEEARAANVSAEMAYCIAKKLVNFDLDAAEMLLAQRDFSSPIHESLWELLRNLRSYRPFLPNSLFSEADVDVHEAPNEAMATAMKDRSTSWEAAETAVRRLRDPNYSLKAFHSDIERAFPELQLYKLGFTSEVPHRACSSGRTGLEEYQRTMGAMYSVYCLARLDIDGKEIFSFGVDEAWKPLDAPCGESAGKRRTFYSSMDWDSMLELLLRAGLLTAGGRSGRNHHSMRRLLPGRTFPPQSFRRKPSRSSIHCGEALMTRSFTDSLCTADAATSYDDIEVNSDRMMAFLVLTAVHDVMKNTLLLPTVQKPHSPYQGISEGSEISDHDVALAYVMEHFPSLLPSFQGLEPGQRAPILFTQGKMGFNNGWLVQGEAPPGHLFSMFKRVVVQGRASESDISFYFAHWLTDLAGAEPYDSRPWPGSEKFVLKFPLKVLTAFLESFTFVDHLANKSEVEVMEEYLLSRWSALGPPVERVTEECGVAAMRLALMAQGFEAQAVAALLSLPPLERDLIAAEMARTGHRQQFLGAPASLQARPTGPAFLVYYAPALVQKAAAEQATEALLVLAAVYRAARELFPLDTSPSAIERTAVIRIDALKVMTPAQIFASGAWHLRRTSGSDAEAVQGVPDRHGVAAGVARIDLSPPASQR